MTYFILFRWEILPQSSLATCGYEDWVISKAILASLGFGDAAK
jgi:hypothetical protein